MTNVIKKLMDYAHDSKQKRRVRDRCKTARADKARSPSSRSQASSSNVVYRVWELGERYLLQSVISTDCNASHRLA